jgi:cyclohexadieny/prephenate dehydrogenase
MADAPLFDRLCLIGVGLIGSSIARVAQARGDIARIVVAHTRRPETLARVRELGLPMWWRRIRPRRSLAPMR